MEVVILNNPDEVAQYGADICVDLIQKKPTAVLGLATGSTPLALYRELVRHYQNKRISFHDIKTFNLDEYVGLSGQHPQSYRHYMNKNLFSHVDIRAENVFIPNGMADDPGAEGRKYDETIKAKGGIDLQILGIGRNGHIGFNEPTSSLSSRTRVKTLAESTIQDNSRFFSNDEFQPVLGITMGIGTIMEARQIILLATGEAKADAVAQAVEGPVSSMCPASMLQMHPNVTLILDNSSAQDLKLNHYYKWVFTQKRKLQNQHRAK